MPTAKSQTLSAGLHVALVAALLLLKTRSTQVTRPTPHPVIVFQPRRAPAPLNRVGGSNQTALPARHGAPPPTAHRTFIPPVSRPEPKLPMPVTVAFESPTIEINVQHIGDPASLLATGGL